MVPWQEQVDLLDALGSKLLESEDETTDSIDLFAHSEESCSCCRMLLTVNRDDMFSTCLGPEPRGQLPQSCGGSPPPPGSASCAVSAQ